MAKKKVARVSSLKHYEPQYLAAAVLDVIETIKARSGLCEVEFDDHAWTTHEELRLHIYSETVRQWELRTNKHRTEFPFSLSAVTALFARFQRIGVDNWARWRQELFRDFKLPLLDRLPLATTVFR